MNNLDNKNTKQVIVFRKDLMKGEHSIRKGKIAAQVAHASLGALLKLGERRSWLNDDGFDHYELTFSYNQDSVLDKWLNGIFTKICVTVENEEELLKLYDEVSKTNIPCALITDIGNTEFHGVPTNTCIGIGPWWSDEIDEYTKELKLF